MPRSNYKTSIATMMFTLVVILLVCSLTVIIYQSSPRNFQNPSVIVPAEPQPTHTPVAKPVRKSSTLAPVPVTKP